MHHCESCPSTATLKELLEQKLNKLKDCEKSNYFKYGTTERAILITFTATYGEYTKTLIDVADDLARHS